MASLQVDNVLVYHRMNVECAILICKSCKEAIWLDQLFTHFKSKHKDEIPSRRRRQFIALIEETYPGALQSKDIRLIPHTIDAPMPIIPVLTDGLRCHFDNKCPHVSILRSSHVSHLHIAHQVTDIKRHTGQGYRVSCQKIKSVMPHSQQYIAVRASLSSGPPKSVDQPSQTAQLNRSYNLATDIFGQLDSIHAQQQQDLAYLNANPQKAIELSPWLRRTQWHAHLEGQHLPSMAGFLTGPNSKEADLMALHGSLDRLVESARMAVLKGDINPFDQVRINTWRTTSKRNAKPILVDLHKDTWKIYVNTWKRLLNYIYHVAAWLTPTSVFKARLTTHQMHLLHRAKMAAAMLIAEPGHTLHQYGMDRACLVLCISLLDHQITGNLYDSIVVSYSAVIGIDTDRNCFREPGNYTSILSGFIKIAQLLVLRQAMATQEDNPSITVSESITSMCDRFMLVETYSPMAWLSKLRMYGKTVLENSTCVGHIEWSDNGSTISYKEMKLSIDEIRETICEQITKADEQLTGLLMLAPQERLSDHGIEIDIHALKEDMSNTTPGYNFTHHLGNQLRDCWLMQRVLSLEHLRRQYLRSSEEDQAPVWILSAAIGYVNRVDNFLQIMLFLIHITSGQPARGPEIIGLRHSNDQLNHHRNIFIDNGLVSTVTRYHKNYSASDSFKVIHRYLPSQVGQLLVTYLMLVQPFCVQLDKLALRHHKSPTPFLWPHATNHETSWDSARLTDAIRTAFKSRVKDITTIGISQWRHLAVAIAREFLVTRCPSNSNFFLVEPIH